MKHANFSCVGIEIACAYCAEIIPQTETGSEFWLIDEITETTKCDSCKKLNDTQLPKSVKQHRS